MAYVRNKTWGPTHPSAAFLIKCAKEQEKLRTLLQQQLQEHMLYMLEESLFADTKIGILSGKNYTSTTLSSDPQYSDIQNIVHAHKPILKVRVPAFHDYLCNHKEADLGITTYNSFLQGPQIQQFLRKVYTDDDIRKHECEILRISKTYIEILNQQRNYFHDRQFKNKHIAEVDEFEKESANSSCTDNFVTPKTSPVTPEKSLDVSEMFQSSQKNDLRFVTKDITMLPPDDGSQQDIPNIKKNSETVKAGISNQGDLSEGYISEIDNNCDDKGMQGNAIGISMKYSYNALESFEANVIKEPVISEKKMDRLIDECSSKSGDSFPSPVGSDEIGQKISDLSDSSPAETTTNSSMVRSNTFDLHRQACLEDFIENNSHWESSELDESKIDNDGSSCEMQNVFRDNEGSRTVLSEAETCSSFYLHNPSKSNSFRSSCSRESQLIASQDHGENGSSGVYWRKLDGSMSDSGFLSHSTFSILSDSGIPNSVSSSLIISSDNTQNSSIVNSGITTTDVPTAEEEATKKSSGSMFPFYIDMSNLPLEKSVTSREEKSKSGSSVYMFIDASNSNVSDDIHHENSIKQNSHDEDVHSENRKIIVEENGNNFIKVSPSSQTKFSKKEHSSPTVVSKSSSITKPESCYMYIDLNSVKKDNSPEQKKSFVGSAPLSISMFVDLKETKEVVKEFEIQQTVRNMELQSNSKNKEIPKSVQDKENTNLNTLFDDKANKLSDKLMNNLKSDKKRGLSYHIKGADQLSDYRTLDHHDVGQSVIYVEQRSLSALDYHSYSKQNKNMENQTFYSSNANITTLQKSSNLHRPHHMGNDERSHSKTHTNSTLPANFKSRSASDVNHMKSLSSKIFNCSSRSLGLRNESDADEEFHANRRRAINEEKYPQTFSENNEVDKGNIISNEEGLLPMSPILRRKSTNKDLPKPSPPPVTIKASTRPQDIDAMTFRKSDRKESPKVNKKLVQDDNSVEGFCKYGSPRKRLEQSEDPKSSSESLKLVSEGFSECGDGVLKDKSLLDPMSRSGSSVMTVSGDTSSSGKHTPFDVSKDRLLQSPPSWSLSYDFEDDSETIYSEVSDVSSSLGGIASLERRWRERQTLESDALEIHNMCRLLEACSKLGEDLLRMFLEEIDTDVTVAVDGKQFKAHKCILSARCKYFAAMLRGNRSETTESVINLHGFSHASVHFALCHIYSGAMNLPKDMNIAELALLADMLNLDTLTDVIVFHLKMHYCHFFHRPCSTCTQGVMDCLQLTATCGLNELRDKCIYWLGKYFTRTWPNKAFSNLPEEFRDQCYNCTLSNVSINSVIEMILQCDRLITTLPHMKWTEQIFGMVTRLLQDCIHFLAQNFNQILCCEGFLALGKGQSWNVTALEDDIISAVELLTPDVACKSYVKLNQILPLAEPDGGLDYGEFTQNFVDLLHKINRHCERYLIHNANKVVHCKSWAFLSPDVQKRIKHAAVIVFEFEKPIAPPPFLSSLQRKLKKQKEDENTGCLERSTYPKKGKLVSIPKFYQDQFSFKTPTVQSKRDDSVSSQKGELEVRIKKIVSPIKEEVQNHIMDFVSHTTADEYISYPNSILQLKEDAENMSNVLCKGSLKLIKDNDLREVHALSRANSLTSRSHLGEDSVNVVQIEDGSGAGGTDSEDNRSTAQCSDNADSLDANEETSCESKDELDRSVSVEDVHYADKMPDTSAPFLEAPNTAPKEDSSSIPIMIKGAYSSVSMLPKSTATASGTRDNKVPTSNPALPNFKKLCSQNFCDIASMKSTTAKPTVPSSKAQEVQANEPAVSPNNSNKDLVAEIDADSRMVTHCLQEAEMLEQQLSRKLQRQHQAVSASSISHYIPSSPARAVPSQIRKTSRGIGYTVQKSSSTTQIKSAPTRRRSPGSQSVGKPFVPSLSSPHVSRTTRNSESSKDYKLLNKKTSQKSNISSTQRSFRSMESITTVSHRQVSVTSVASGRRHSSRSRSSAVLGCRDGRSSGSTAK